MLRRTTLRYFISCPLASTRLGGRLLTTTSNTGTARTTITPTSASTSTTNSTPTTPSSEYTSGNVKLAEQWHKKTDVSSSRTGGGNASGGGGSGRRPARGGQNLSVRYTRLENAVRGKQARAEAQAVNVSAATVAATSTAMGAVPDVAAAGASVGVPEPVPVKKGKPVEMFRGLVVPEEPMPPADDECCMSGCAVCVYDLHEEELEAYETALTTLRTSLVALGVPQAEWPPRVRPASTSTLTATANAHTPSSNSAAAQSQDKSRKGAVLSALEEMERRLAEKHRAEDQADAGSETGAGVGVGIGMDREEKLGVEVQAAVASISPNGQELHWSVNPITGHTVPHWRERQLLAAKTQQAARRRTFWTELYEGVRWMLFSNR